MVKTVLSVPHEGLKNWLIQRLTAMWMTLYLIFLCIFLLKSTDLSFADWQGLFSYRLMKIATILFFLSVVYHAWIGMWTIFTDYVKCPIFRMVLNLSVLLFLTASFLWGIMILWSV